MTASSETDVPEQLQPNEPRFGVIVVNWKNVPDTIDCLDSLASACPRPDRVVVVDNGSADGSIEQLVEWATTRGVAYELGRPGASAPGAAWLTIVDAGANLGFAGGNNVGLSLLEREASLTHFLLLNNDALVAPDYFAQIAAGLEHRREVGLSIGTIYEAADRARVWYAGGRILPRRALAVHELRVPENGEPVHTHFVTGCAMVIARPALERAGMLAECYFPGYMEDVEYSWRVRDRGLELLYIPRAVVYHKIGSSFGARAVSPLTAYHQNRHRLYFARRNLRGTDRLAALVYMALTKPGRAVIDMIAGHPRVSWAVLRGTVAGMVTRPDSRRARSIGRA